MLEVQRQQRQAEQREQSAQRIQRQQEAAAPQERPLDAHGQPLFSTKEAVLSDYAAVHEALLLDSRFREAEGAALGAGMSLVSGNLVDLPPTRLEVERGLANVYVDEPRLSALSQRRIATYEHMLDQLTLCECCNCGRRLLEDCRYELVFHIVVALSTIAAAMHRLVWYHLLFNIGTHNDMFDMRNICMRVSSDYLQASW